MINPLTKKKFSKLYYSTLKITSTFPVYKKANDFIKLLDRHDIIIIESSTGSGKSVGCPIIALKHYEYNAKIILTQPRVVNIAGAAKFIAQQLDVKLGDQVGFLHGQDKNFDIKKTKIFVCTDSIFDRVIKMIENIREDDQVVVFIDEVHERSIYMDLILAYVCRKFHEIKFNQDDELFKFVLLSATLDVGFYKSYFEKYGASVGTLTIGGGTRFPVDHKFISPHNKVNYKNVIYNIVDLIIKNYIDTYCPDILIFLPVISVCAKGADILKSKVDTTKIYINSLSRITPSKEKDIIIGIDKYTNYGYRQRIIFSTPVSETGVTFESVNGRNIDIVIDSGFENQVIYNPKIGFKQQSIEYTTMASVIQRCGRAGRVTKGTCIHIYSENIFNTEFAKYIPPKIKNTTYYDLIISFLKIRENLNDVLVDIRYLPTKLNYQQLNYTILNLYKWGILYDGRFSKIKGIIATDLGISERYGILIMNSFKYKIQKYIVPIAIFLHINSKFHEWISTSKKDVDIFKNRYGIPISFLILWEKFKKFIRMHKVNPNSIEIYFNKISKWCSQKNYNYELFKKFTLALKKTESRLNKYQKELGQYSIENSINIDENVKLIEKIIIVFTQSFPEYRLTYVPFKRKYVVRSYNGYKTEYMTQNAYPSSFIDFTSKPSILGCCDILITSSSPILACPFVIANLEMIQNILSKNKK